MVGDFVVIEVVVIIDGVGIVAFVAVAMVFTITDFVATAARKRRA